MTQGDIIQRIGRLHRQGQQPVVMGCDMARGSDDASLAIVGNEGVLLTVSRSEMNAKSARRKADREFLARVIVALMSRHDAIVERRDEPRNPGYSGASIVLKFSLNGVGATFDIDDLHGGDWAIIDWYNTGHPVRNFSPRFHVVTGNKPPHRPHHKATSIPHNWYSLAMMLDAGLCLAARGDAFDPAKV